MVLGTLSVLRSNALSTGRTALLAIGGTVVGFVIAAVLTLAIGTSAGALWVTLPIVAFLAAYVPTAVSFLVGQAAFTLFVVVLFDLLQPQGWRLGLVRLEDIALGVGVSVVVAVLLWPRGARGQLGSALAALYRADAACLDAAFGYLLGDGSQRQVDASRRAAETEVDRAAAAFEVFLTERGSRTLPAATWARVAAAGNDVLFAADAMELMGLLGYRPDGCQQCVDQIRRDAAAVVGVFTGFAGQLQQRRAPPARRRCRLPASMAGCAGLPAGSNRYRPGHSLVLEWGDRPPRRRAGPTPRRGGRRRPIPLVAMITLPVTSRQPRVQPLQWWAAVSERLHWPPKVSLRARRSPIVALVGRGAPRMRSSRRDVGGEPMEAKRRPGHDRQGYPRDRRPLRPARRQPRLQCVHRTRRTDRCPAQLPYRHRRHPAHGRGTPSTPPTAAEQLGFVSPVRTLAGLAAAWLPPS